jgi:replicative DNA helicase
MQAGTQLQIEGRVLGAILAKGDALYELPAGFVPQAFSRDTFRRAFEAMERLGKAKRLPVGPVDVTWLVAEAGLPDGARIELETAEAEADSLVNRARLADNAGALLDRYRRASLTTLLGKAADALRGDAPTEEITGKLVARLLDLDQGEKAETVSFREAALSFVDAIEAHKGKKGSVLKSGFADLDSMLKIRKGNLIVLAARPGVGKTTLALNVADNVALAGGKVLAHSLEMADAELVTLALSRAAKIDSQEFFEEEGWPAEKWERISTALNDRIGNGDGNLHINDSHHSLGAICRITEKMHRKHGLSLVIVDYLQLIQCDLGKNATRENQVSTISRTLKLMAQRLQIPVLALSQLNRDPEKRGQTSAQPVCFRCGVTKGKHRPDDRHPFEPQPLAPPKLHDLRESGAIEQDANAVMFLHNPQAEHPDPNVRALGPYELVIAKQRLGKKGKVRLVADLKHSQFKPFSNSVAAPGHWMERGDN